MHPDIRKFWEAAGYRIENADQIGTGVVSGVKRTSSKFDVSIIEVIGFGDRHRFNKVWYSEEEMLRLIKMKALL